MNSEFHYYVTHLIAARAGVRGDDLRVLAYASQYVDDNNRVYQVKRSDLTTLYQNSISQTLNILKPHKEKLEIYPLFHFIPGEPDAPSTKRSDGKTDVFNTTPNSLNANRVMDAALETQNFYRIGIATHAYVDTWAHQNFIGARKGFNAFPSFWARLVPNYGHADAGHKPDLPRLQWQDNRLVASSVDNTQRFLDAAAHLFDKLWRFANKGESAPAVTQMNRERQSLIEDLSASMGDAPREDHLSKARLARYQALASTAAYGAASIPDYNQTAWFKHIVKTTTHSIRSGGRNTQQITRTYRPGYRASDWYQFQEAVKRHAECAKAILCENPAIAREYGA